MPMNLFFLGGWNIISKLESQSMFNLTCCNKSVCPTTNERIILSEWFIDFLQMWISKSRNLIKVQATGKWWTLSHQESI